MDMQATTTEAYPQIIQHLQDLDEQGSRVGGTREEEFVVVRSENPRDRFIFRDGFNLAFALQECHAYWNGLNPGLVHRYNTQMESYMTDGVLNGSAYGERLRATQGDQIRRVIKQLYEHPETRRAVMVIHQPSVEDYDGKDVACTIYLHPLLRDGKLDLIANLRSQDMLWGYPYDVQAFQWIQEVLAGILEVDVGRYIHAMNSCHYYTDYEDQVIESKLFNHAEPMPDCRLTATEFGLANSMLSRGLEAAREHNIEFVRFCIDVLESLSDYYADWLKVMSSYECHRFHDDTDNARLIAETVFIDSWHRWINDKVHG